MRGLARFGRQLRIVGGIRRLVKRRQRKVKGGAFARFRFDPDTAAMPLDDFAGNR